jgi:FkbM family methyltransferase
MNVLTPKLRNTPFERTLKNYKKQGLSNTISLMIGASLNFLTSRLRYASDSAVIKTNGYYLMVYPKSAGIHRDLFFYRKREPMVTDFLRGSGLLQPGDAALDIGANIGYYAIMESKLVGKKGIVYAVEPVTKNMRLLKRNVSLNRAFNVHVSQLAFGASKGDGEIHLTKKCNLCTLKDTAPDIVGKQPVSIDTVDEFLESKRFPKLVRMDVEGYEYEILKGMPKTLKKGVNLLIEVHPNVIGDLDGFLDCLDKYGYFARFIVYERARSYNSVVQTLRRKAGAPYPKYYKNLRISKVRRLLKKQEQVSPNIFFSKK